MKGLTFGDPIWPSLLTHGWVKQRPKLMTKGLTLRGPYMVIWHSSPMDKSSEGHSSGELSGGPHVSTWTKPKTSNWHNMETLYSKVGLNTRRLQPNEVCYNKRKKNTSSIVVWAIDQVNVTKDMTQRWWPHSPWRHAHLHDAPLMRIERPCPLGVVSGYLQDPDENHWKIILKYLRNTKDRCLSYENFDLKLMKYDSSFQLDIIIIRIRRNTSLS